MTTHLKDVQLHHKTEMQTKTPMRYYFIPIKTDKNIKLNNIKCW